MTGTYSSESSLDLLTKTAPELLRAPNDTVVNLVNGPVLLRPPLPKNFFPIATALLLIHVTVEKLSVILMVELPL